MDDAHPILCTKFQLSGYSSAERLEIYQRAKRKYDERIENDHNGTVPMYMKLKVEIISAHPGDAMLCQTTEATLICELKPALNRKDEFGNSNVPRERKSNTNGGSCCKFIPTPNVLLVYLCHIATSVLKGSNYNFGKN